MTALVIGLVNSMPGEARRHTEQQFRALLAAAAGDVAIELRLYALGGTMAEGTNAASGYRDAATLEADMPDGLIVTGMPPRAASLTDEPYWGAFTALVDAASDHAVPTVWSCLAAHAAVLHLDGIARRRLPQKLSGVFACARTEAAHPSVAGLPARWQVPHSRYNDLPEAALHAAGYRVLARSAEVGADLFAKDDGAPFLFCQGHPEYDAQTLLREYRRDVRQFLSGERDGYPDVPRGCFGAEVAALLAAFRARAECQRRSETFADFPTAACIADLTHAWDGVAVGLYANWIAQVAARRAGAELSWSSGAAGRMGSDHGALV